MKHLVFANGIYESSGGQALVNRNEVNWVALARGVGFRDAKEIRKEEEFLADLPSLLKNSGHAFRVLHVEPGSGKDISPPENVLQLKRIFREALLEQGMNPDDIFFARKIHKLLDDDPAFSKAIFSRESPSKLT